jgi:hypothetical protein
MKLHMMQHAIAGAVALALVVAGCSSVMTQYPLSAQPKPVDKDKFEGIWIEGPIHVHFASNGVARIAAVEWGEDQFGLFQGEMIVTEGKKDNFISVRIEAESAWHLRQYKFTVNDDLLVWEPNSDAFAVAIETNLLLGSVQKSSMGTPNVEVTDSPDEMLDFLNDPERRDLFNYRNPQVLRRIAAPPVAGCSFSVMTQYPLSAPPNPVDKDKFEGIWLIDEQLPVYVMSASNGVARIAVVNWEEDNFRLIQGEMILTEGKEGDNFISLRLENEEEWKLFLYKFKGNGDLLAWEPNSHAFEAAIKTNLLLGSVSEGGIITVTNSPDEMLAFMNDPERRDLFKYRDPMVLRRILGP